MPENRMLITAFESGPFHFHLVTDGAGQSKMRQMLDYYQSTDSTPGKVDIVRLYIAHWAADSRNNPPEAQIATVRMIGMRQGAYRWCSEDPERVYLHDSLEAAAIAVDREHGYGWDTCYAPWAKRMLAWHERHGGEPSRDYVK